MAFYLEETDENGMFGRVVDFYRGKLDEDEEYGSPILATVKYDKEIKTVGDLKNAIYELCDKKYAG